LNRLEGTGKVVKVVGIAATPIFFTEGQAYAADVYDAGPMMQTASGAAQALLPLGPADSTATWDMTQAEVASGNTGWVLSPKPS